MLMLNHHQRMESASRTQIIKYMKQNHKTGFNNTNEMKSTEDSILQHMESDPCPTKESELEYVAESPAKNDKTMIQHPGDDHLVSDVAAKLGKALQKEKVFFVYNGEIVRISNGQFAKVDATEARTLVELYVTPCRKKHNRDGDSVLVRKSFLRDDMNAMWSSPTLKDKLDEIDKLSYAPLPYIGSDKKLRFLKNGYDEESCIYTISEDDDQLEDCSVDDAISTIKDYLQDFQFVDESKSFHDILAFMVGQYLSNVMPYDVDKPCVLLIARSEGTGKTTLARMLCYPFLGSTPIGAMPKSEIELKNTLDSSAKTGSPILLFDNVKDHLNSSALEGFITNSDWSFRRFHSQEMIACKKQTTVVITGNSLSLSEDMRRRILSIELTLHSGSPEERTFNRCISNEYLKSIKPNILSALRSLVCNWFNKGMLMSNKSHGSWPEWSKTVGGVLEAAGITVDFSRSDKSMVSNSEYEDIKSMMKLLIEKDHADCNESTFSDLAYRSYNEGLFEDIFKYSESDEELIRDTCEIEPNLDRSQRSKFAKLIKKYEGRWIDGCQLIAKGKGKTRKYSIVMEGQNND
jgi:hypothetical protein